MLLLNPPSPSPFSLTHTQTPSSSKVKSLTHSNERKKIQVGDERKNFKWATKEKIRLVIML